MHQPPDELKNENMVGSKIDPKGKSIPQIFGERAVKDPDAVAFRFKNLGVYQAVSWEEYYRHVEDFCLGLLEYGLVAGDRIAIMGDCCPKWLYSSLAAECAGAIDYGVYSTCSPEEVRYLVENGEPRFFVAENQEYVDKLLPNIDQFSYLQKLIVMDPSGMFGYDHPKLATFDDVSAMGRRRKAESGEKLIDYIGRTCEKDTAFIVYTSGTTGFPKGVMLSHENVMISFIEAMLDYFPEIVTHSQRAVSHLSLAHILERAVTIYAPLLYDLKPHLGESVAFFQETLYEVQPTFLHAVPRIWEKMAGQVVVQIMNSSWLKRRLYALAMKVSTSYLKDAWGKKTPPALYRAVLKELAEYLVFRPMRRNVGLRHVRYALSAGAPLPPSVQALWHTWGVDLVNVYGSTEVGGLVTVQDPGYPKPGSLGRPTSSWNRFRLAADGEILVKGPGVFQGYWREPELTAETIKDGWVCMGETGKVDEAGNLHFGERLKDIMVTTGGKNITPTLIENAIKASPYISEVIVFADGRKYPSALIEIDFNTVSEWARRKGVLYTGFTSLANHPKTYKLIQEAVMSGNRALARVEQIKKFRILPKELDAEVGETTPTRKIKRSHTYELFKDLVEEMYSSEEEALIQAQLDGHKMKGVGK